MERSKMKTILKILAIVIICLISFVGIYVQRLNFMENKVKEYKLGEELGSYREIFFSINNDTSDELKTVENYEKTKTLFEQRLNGLGVQNYNVNLDKNTGNMYVQLEENDDTDTIITNLKDTGTFVIKDSEDGTVLLDNSKIKNARVVYNTTDNGTIVFLEIQFNKEGSDILKDITSNTYAKPEDANTTESSSEETSENTTNTSAEEGTENETNTTAEENTESEEKTEKKITLSISGQDITTTNFEKPIETGTITLTMNNAIRDSKQIAEYAKSGNILATIINNGPLPIGYTVSLNQNVSTDISLNSVIYVLVGVGAVICVLLIYMIIKNKVNGLLAAISFIGFIALYLLLLRYTNVVISLASIVGIAIIAIINYWYNMKILSNKKENSVLIKLIPILIISIIFAFVNWSEINTFGMTTMWGILLMIVYNSVVTKNMIDRKE